MVKKKKLRCSFEKTRFFSQDVKSGDFRSSANEHSPWALCLERDEGLPECPNASVSPAPV